MQSLGGIDIASLYKVMTPDKFWETIVVTGEGAMREILAGSSYAAGRVVDDILVIVDLKDFGFVLLLFPSWFFLYSFCFSLGKFWQMKNLVRDSFQMSQDYLPET